MKSVLLVIALLFVTNAAMSQGLLQDFKPSNQLSADSLTGPQAASSSDFNQSFLVDPDYDFDRYRVGMGDKFNLHLWGGQNILVQVYVAENGVLILPYVGTLDVKGKTLKEVRSTMDRLVKKRFTNTKAALALQTPRNFRVSVNGAVGNPSAPISATQLTRLRDALSAAGGFSSSASLINIEIYNQYSDTKKIYNYQDYLLKGERSQNPFLMEGDEVRVPFKLNEVVIKGNVNQPGAYQFSGESIFLSEIVDKYFGGLRGAQHVYGDVSITRVGKDDTQKIIIPQKEFFNEDSKINFWNFELKNGDFVYFPLSVVENPAKSNVVFVTGEVKGPGPIPYIEGGSLSHYLSASGGLTVRANFNELIIYKANGGRVNPKGMSFVVEPGDTIHVPEVTFRFWQDHLAILTTFLTVVTTTIAISR